MSKDHTKYTKAELLRKLKISEQRKELQHEVDMATESKVSNIIEAALAACDKAKSVGEMRRLRRLANEKIRFYTQMSRKEDYL